MENYRKEVRAFLSTYQDKFILVRAFSYAPGAFSPPKGGVKKDEEPEAALYRELFEELSIESHNIGIQQKSKIMHIIEFPSEIQEKYGQKGAKITSYWVKLLTNSYSERVARQVDLLSLGFCSGYMSLKSLHTVQS